MSLKKKAATIDLGKLVAGATAGVSPAAPSASGGGMTAIGIHAETVYRDRQIAEENRSLKEMNAHLVDELAEFKDSDLTKRLDPTLVHASKWANRNEASFSTQAFEALKAEIESAGGNVQPIKVRPIQGRAGEYEIVFGHRRHRACLELGLQVLSVVDDLDDANLFAQMDRENRHRADLRPYEQGVMYVKALNEGLFPSMRKMAEALGVDIGGVSKLVAMAKLPSDILGAFKSPLDIQFGWGPQLGDALQKNPDLVLNLARDIASRNPRPNANAVFKELVLSASSSGSSGDSPSPDLVKPVVLCGGAGRTGKIAFDQKKGSFEISLLGVDPKRLGEIERLVKAFINY